MSFYIVEGCNGSGKTTLIKNFAAKGYKTLSSPNGTPLAQMLRPACRGTEPWEDINKTVQFLLFSAARLDEYVRCVEGVNEPVIADRWWTSTFVYQCVLQGIPLQFLEYTMHHQEKIDGVILLYGDPEVLVERVMAEREKNPVHGMCTWTKEKSTILRLAEIYERELPIYLEKRSIPCFRIDATKMSTNEVFEKSKLIVDRKTMEFLFLN